MTFKIPSLRDIKKATNEAFRAELPGTDVEAYPNNIAVIATVIAGSIYQLYAFLQDLKKQQFVETATWGLDYHVKERPMSARKDGEGNDDLKARIQQADQNLPEGGNEGDYERWTRNFDGVTRAYVQRIGLGVGTVVIWPLMDETRPNGIPTDDDCIAIKTFVEDQAPIFGQVFIEKATPQVLNIVIGDLSPDTAEVREEINQEFIAYFKTINQITKPNKTFKIYQSTIDQVISNATKEEHHLLVSPLGIIVFESATIPVFGGVTFE